MATRSTAFSKKIDVLKIEVTGLTTPNVVELNSLLAYGQRMTVLTINVQGLSIAQCLRLFSNLRLPNLACFSTQGLPHEGLYAFINRHPTITNITLGPCNRVGTQCALESTNSLQRLGEVRGDFKCVSKLVSSTTHRIFARASTTHNFGYLDLFQKISSVNAIIRLCSMEYAPGDTDVMPRLAAALSRVSTLRLVQSVDGVS